MKIEEALAVVDKCLQRRLNHVQELVLSASWQGYSYQECAKAHGYTPEYIKTVGYKLWQLLSSTFKEPVNKNNLKSVLRRHSLVQKTLFLDSESQNTNNSETSINQSTIATEKAQRVRQNWGETVDVSVFYGRTEELMTLEQWIVEEHCRLIGIFGMAGIGKTALSCKLIQQIQDEFDCIFWRSLSHQPSFTDFITELILFLSNQQQTEVDLPHSLEAKISLLINYLRSAKCLIVLDNIEEVLCSKIHAGSYRQGYEGYGELFRRIGEVQHQSTIVLTSQEKPKEVELLEGERLAVRSLRLSGLNQVEAQAIFEDKGYFFSSQKERSIVVEYYAGNPLFLKIVASSIQDLFDSNFSEFIKFLQEHKLIIDDVHQVLDRQFERLSKLEESVMYWLAINRQPVSLQELRDHLQSPREKQKLPEAIRSLERRSLIEKNLTKFTQEPVIMQYVVERFIEQISEEMTAQEINLAKNYPLSTSKVKSNHTGFTVEPIALENINLEPIKLTQTNLLQSFFAQAFAIDLPAEFRPKQQTSGKVRHTLEDYPWQGSDEQKLLNSREETAWTHSVYWQQDTQNALSSSINKLVKQQSETVASTFQRNISKGKRYSS